MESLFVHPTPKRWRVCVMLGVSLLLHGGIIGVAGIWKQPEPPEHSVEVTWTDVETGSDNAQQPKQEDSPQSATPAPPVVEIPMSTPPVAGEDPLIYEPAQTPPTRRLPVSKPLVPTHTTRTATTNVRSGSFNSTSVGTNGPFGNGSAVSVGAWVTPHPPYPQSMLLKRSAAASTTVHITTDASGQISSVIIVKSAGNPLLDSYTETYVRSHWRGPANASRNTEFVYQTR